MKQLSKNLEFDITLISKQVELRRKQLIILFILFPIYGVIFNPHNSTLHLTLYLVAFFIVLITNVMFYSMKKRYKLNGKLLLNINFIQANNENFLLKDIERVKLTYKGFKGESFPLSAVGIGTFGVKDGADNLFEIKTKNGNIRSFSFLSKNKNDKKGIMRILMLYKKNGIKIE